MKRLLPLLLLLLAAPSFADEKDVLCLRCDRWGGSQGGGSGDPGTPPAAVSACYTGNGVDSREIPVGFAPQFVYVAEVSENTVMHHYRFAEMGADLSCELGPTLAAPTCEANHIMSFTSNGFVLGTNARVNGAGQLYCYVALQSKADFLDIANYIGTGAALNVPTTFVPDVVDAFISRIDNGSGGFIHRQADGAFSNAWNATLAEDFSSGYITAFNEAAPPLTLTPSFTMNTGTGSNSTSALDSVYDYLAWNDQPGFQWIDYGTYTGAGEATKTITTSCNTIAAVFLHHGNASSFACDVWRPAALSATILNPFVAGDGVDWALSSSSPGKPEGIRDLNGNTGSFTIVKDNGAGSWFCTENGEDYMWFAICGGNEADTVPAADVTSNFAAVWKFENAAGSAALNEAGTTCLTNCDMADNNSVSRSTFTPLGVQSADFVRAETDNFSCVAATCAGNATTDRLFIPAGGSATWGGWLQGDLDTALEYALSLGNNGTSDRPQYQIGFSSAADRGFCSVTNTVPTKVVMNGATNGRVVGAWAHWVCVFNNGADTLQLYKNSVANGTVAAVTNVLQTVTGLSHLGISDVPDLGFDGEQYEMFMIHSALSTLQIAYIMSCGIDGAQCTCFESDPTLYASKGLNATFGSPALPDCNSGGW